MAICEYLEDAYPDHPLLPSDPIKKAQVRGFCEVINSAIHPYQNLRVLKKVSEDYGGDKIKWAKEWILRGTKTLETMLEKTHGKYCFGDEVTLADAFLVPHAMGAIARFGVDLSEYPKCKHVFDNLCELEAFRLAEPKNQPDF
jgi:maleylacetoacetate isomerase